MANLSKLHREKMLSFLQTLKEEHSDDASIIALNAIETALTDKKYGLVWEEHSERVDNDLLSMIPVFSEVKQKQLTAGDGYYNFVLEGDNLHSLYLLEKTHRGNIDVIYIDPPYNTGNEDFSYDDNYVELEDSFRHSKWLSFMERRLRIAWQLLKDEGIIFISIDESEAAPLLLLCNDIFGEDNYQSTIHVQVRYAQKSLTEEKPFKPVIEYVYVFSKDFRKFAPNRPQENYSTDKFTFVIEELSKGERINPNGYDVTVFKKGEWKLLKMPEGQIDGLKETWISGTIYTKMSYGKVFRDIVEPRVAMDGLGCLYKVHGRGDDGLGYRYYTGPARKNAKRGKMYSGVPVNRVTEIENMGESTRYLPINTFFDFAADFGNIAHEGGVTFNSGKKPTKMLQWLINLCPNKSAIVLDFFAGSGSTGHAVVQLNDIDGGDRRYILCNSNESKICELKTYPRLCNIQAQTPHNLKYYKTDYIPRFIEEGVSDALLPHIHELVELENAIDLSNPSFALIQTEEELDEFFNHENQNTSKVIYLSSDVLTTKGQQEALKNLSIEIKTIPQYYFAEELKQAGEL
jgi:adenine-specific DNA-methyltransferase